MIDGRIIGAIDGSLRIGRERTTAARCLDRKCVARLPCTTQPLTLVQARRPRREVYGVSPCQRLKTQYSLPCRQFAESPNRSDARLPSRRT
jgi:hypothetical protein